MDINALLERALKRKEHTLTEHESKQVLQAFGMPVISETVVQNQSEVAQAAAALGWPVVLKGMGTTLTHKTERGLVHLKLSDERAVQQAAADIAAEAGTELEGFLLQPWVAGERELVSGLFRDPQFGPVVMFGLGGVLTEILMDVSFRLASAMTATDALEMITEIRAAKILDAFRGQAPVNRQHLVQILMGLARIGSEYPQVSEIDINPLVVSADGNIVAVDALLVVKPESEPPRFLPAVKPDALRPIFYPRSIAFVGASAQMGKWGHMLVANTIGGGYEGPIFLVNPKGGTIADREVYPSVAELPEPVDLAVVTIPATKVAGLIPQFKACGIRQMLLISSGFRETGSQGRALETELVRLATEAGILILGPNTMGICNPHIRLNCTSLPVAPRPGRTALVSQSGNMGTQFLAFAEKQDIGIRGFCGSGNEAMMTMEDYLDAFEADDITRTVLLYVESVKNGPRFFESAQRVGRKKPVVLMKGGQTEAGGVAAASHTGALSSDARIFNAMCRQAGIVKVEKSMDLLDLAAAFSSLPLPQGKRVGIMTLGGGWGVVTADLCAQYGLEVPPLSKELIEDVDTLLPPYWSRANPIDLVGEHDNTLPVTIIEKLLQWNGCDAVINLGILGRRILVGHYITAIEKSDPSYSRSFLDSVKTMLIEFERDYIAQTVRLMEKYNKPVIGVALLTDESDRTVHQVGDSPWRGVFYTTPEKAVKTLSRMYEYQRFRLRVGVSTTTL